MIPHRFRIIEAGAILRIDLPFVRENPAAFVEQTGLDPCTLGYLITGPGAGPLQGLLDSEFSLSVDLSGRPGGAYVVVLDGESAENPAERSEFWRQHVFVQPSLRRTPEQIDALARRFAPVLLFSNKEEYFPVDFETLTASEAIRASTQSIQATSPFASESVPVSSLAEYLRFNGHCDALLDQSLFDHDQVFREIRGSCDRSVVYYSYIEDAEGERFFLNFHTFYAFDPKTGIARLLGVGPHVFDRESLTMVFREDETPESLLLSGHLEGQQILFFDSLQMWSTGRVRLNFSDPRTPSVHNHPIVPVAEGSHALYPTSGLYHISVLTELAGHLFDDILGMGEKRADLDRHQVLLPPSLESDRFARYELRPLRLDLLRSEPLPASPLYDPHSSCLVFSGYWVDVPGLHNERFPPFSKKEEQIGAWVDGAYEWNWNDLPERIVAHDSALSDAIECYARVAEQ